MTAAGFVGCGAPWLALAVASVAASASIWVLMRYRSGERALLALPIVISGAVAGLLVVLVPYLVILPPTSEPVVLAATVSPEWQRAAALVGIGWTFAMTAAAFTAYRYRLQRRRWKQHHG